MVNEPSVFESLKFYCIDKLPFGVTDLWQGRNHETFRFYIFNNLEVFSAHLDRGLVKELRKGGEGWGRGGMSNMSEINPLFLDHVS